MSLYTIKALDGRSGFTGKHRQAPFTRRDPSGSWRQVSIPFSETRELLARELKSLGATGAILEVDVLPGQIRLDGELYAQAKVRTPAVRLHFDSEHGHLTYATDAFTTWQDNVRAIALALEALRKVDRYEVGRGGDQYAGYAALPAGTGGVPLGGMTPQVALDNLRTLAAGAGPVDDLTPARLYRRARARCHPDRHEGRRDLWDRVEQAAQVLGLDRG